MKRKYPKVVSYWVYSLYVPSIDSYYIGYSGRKECSERWLKNRYKRSSLEPYLDEWDNIVKTVIQDGLTKEQAVQLEDELIIKYRNENRCVNQYRSGWIEKNDKNVYAKEFYKTNEELREKRKKRERERYHKNMLNEEFREKERKRSRERRAKKKLKKQQQVQLTLFDLESFDIAS